MPHRQNTLRLLSIRCNRLHHHLRIHPELQRNSLKNIRMSLWLRLRRFLFPVRYWLYYNQEKRPDYCKIIRPPYPIHHCSNSYSRIHRPRRNNWDILPYRQP